MSDYYVSTTGDNTDPGTLAEPWATLTYSETQISSGDTVYVRGGSYHQRWTINVANVLYLAYPGESPVIDGEWDIPVAPDVYTSYGTLLTVYAYGVTIDGFEMKNSTGNILTVYGPGHDDVIIRNCSLHDCYRGVVQLSHGVKGTLIEDCDIYAGAGVLQFCNYNAPLCRDLGYSDPATVTLPNVEDITFRRCKIHDSHNEGINLAHESNNITIEYCEIYGNRKSQIYLCSSTNHTIRYNLIYGTEVNYVGQVGNGGPGIMISHEEQWIEEMGWIIDMNHKIYGNLVANLKSGIDTQLHYAGAKATNISVYNNTFIEAENYGIICGSGTGDGSTYKNNIIWQDAGGCANVPAGLTFDYNLWSKTPDTDAQGANDPSYADPLTIKTSGWNSLYGGELDGSEFALQNSSPAIDAGVNLGVDYDEAPDPTSTWVDNITLLDQDLYGTGWEIGAFVYTGGVTSVAPTTLLTTSAPTTLAPTTLAPTTIGQTTIAPTTLFSSTAVPTTTLTTQPPTTPPPALVVQDVVADFATTSPPTTAPPTSAPTTAGPTTVAPTTIAPTTLVSTTGPTTSAPTSIAPTTAVVPTTILFTTLAPTTLGPTTDIPEVVCVKYLKSTITKEVRVNGNLC